ncbi:MAG: hypothetical protein EAZ60_12255 [Oscillatoriales cyanobacterium]|nr:MAG: hypothetical protein EAZ79_12495 [Oscillatoriales cyanobacterium]TAF55709.1 MAG: hypothetical protein EAZ60_12255 [Oscillatoriales cyanobacterium]
MMSVKITIVRFDPSDFSFLWFDENLHSEGWNQYYCGCAIGHYTIRKKAAVISFNCQVLIAQL